MGEFVNIIRQLDEQLTFTCMEIGALPFGVIRERFYALLSSFPGSRIIAFELDQALCDKLNAKAPKGLEYHCMALGRSEETRALYETIHPMCTSLYAPDDDLLDRYNNLQVAKLKHRSEVATVSLDYFVEQHAITELDFIKIDIQGAEFDVFQGGMGALEKTLWIISEVEFIALYQNQPLFGDVSAQLQKSGLMFHKFRGLAGRPVNGLQINGDIRFPSQVMWSDAVFTKPLAALEGCSDRELLKIAVFAHIYDSPDVTYHCLALHGERHAHSFQDDYLLLVDKLQLISD